ncbi:hypothetical protein NEAUS04_1066 [Nematocida ausubeli]|nr:hypothetical protein NEAUS04_1066 [Nematocida ausubeli]
MYGCATAIMLGVDSFLKAKPVFLILLFLKEHLLKEVLVEREIAANHNSLSESSTPNRIRAIPSNLGYVTSVWLSSRPVICSY